MQFDSAITLLGAVVILLVAIFLGVVYAARDQQTQVSEEDLDELHNRLEAIGAEIALLAAQIRHLEEVEGLQRESTHLREENNRRQHEWRKLLDEVARIAELFGRQPPSDRAWPTRSPDAGATGEGQAESLHGREVDGNPGPLGSGARGRRSCARAPGAARPRVRHRPVYFLSSAFFSAGALDGDFAIDVVGTMMWAYGVPFHITHGPPLVQSVPYASS